MSARRAPALGLDFMGITWVGPAIIAHGTDEQKAAHLESILDGKSHWCTGYSEPDVGSDLAALQCRAVRDGDEYVINGQKIWTTSAHSRRISSCWCGAPTSPSGRASPACWWRWTRPASRSSPSEPLRQGVLQRGLPERRDGPVANRLGAEGEGWRVVMGALANERSGISELTRWCDTLDHPGARPRSFATDGPRSRTSACGDGSPTSRPGSRRCADGLRFLTKQ